MSSLLSVVKKKSKNCHCYIKANMVLIAYKDHLLNEEGAESQHNFLYCTQAKTLRDGEGLFNCVENAQISFPFEHMSSLINKRHERKRTLGKRLM